MNLCPLECKTQYTVGGTQSTIHANPDRMYTLTQPDISKLKMKLTPYDFDWEHRTQIRHMILQLLHNLAFKSTGAPKGSSHYSLESKNLLRSIRLQIVRIYVQVYA